MIKVNSNIKDFLKNYKKKVDKLKTALLGIAEKLAKKMSEDMYKEIQRTEDVWAIYEPENEQDETGKMAYHKGKSFDYWFTIESIDNNSVKVSIGDNARKHVMSDEAIVNPAFFIEFGFGIVGQSNPMKNSEAYSWIYNRNHHITAWGYAGWDGKGHISKGAEGTNFMYNTIQKYKDNWNSYLKELLEEQANG